MLLLVFTCVLGAFVLLVAALLTGTPVWAWVSVAVSVLAAALLLVDSLRRRSAERIDRLGSPSGSGATETADAGATVTVNSGATETADAGATMTVNSGVTETVNLGDQPDDERVAGGPAEPSGALNSDRPRVVVTSDPVVGEPSGSTVIPSGADGPEENATGDSSQTVTITPAQLAPEPDEEAVEPALLAVVASLPDEVLVVDERPRYHLAGCEFLRGCPTIPLPAEEAVDLGFTACALCTPVQVLAQRRGAEKPG